MQQAIETFLETWMEEFGRAVEMFTGVLPALSKIAVTGLPEAEPGSILWRKYIFTGTGIFACWIGAAEAAWSDLGSADPDNPQGTYFEILSQAQSGAATVASRGLDQPISSDAGETMPEADFAAADFALFKLRIDGERIPDLIIALERTALAILEPDNTSEIPGGEYEGNSAKPLATERLLDLELPVAISLGHAELPIRAVPGMRPGAVIELSKENGDDVELLVHGTVVARGEITLIKGNYGIRIKHIVGANDRLSLLKK